ncbi:MAG: hypothetical protein JWM31_54 [Solirubrobacterales bacterium]|nr:hypothetical protein [Solirubrobacterales bacterium]
MIGHRDLAHHREGMLLSGFLTPRQHERRRVSTRRERSRLRGDRTSSRKPLCTVVLAGIVVAGFRSLRLPRASLSPVEQRRQFRAC